MTMTLYGPTGQPVKLPIPLSDLPWVGTICVSDGNLPCTVTFSAQPVASAPGPMDFDADGPCGKLYVGSAITALKAEGGGPAIVIV